jgi:hypothetical protein
MASVMTMLRPMAPVHRWGGRVDVVAERRQSRRRGVAEVGNAEQVLDAA